MQVLLEKVTFLSDFLVSSGRNAEFERHSDEELADNLRHFYAGVRQKPKNAEGQGKDYSRSAYRNMRSGLQRYLVSPPINRRIDLRTDNVFRGANQVYEGRIKQLKKEGKYCTQALHSRGGYA